ncbi:MAG TPA: phosphoribosylformylglycinamidine synthase subunit PurQ [Acidimicrobiales bacterium]|nr:phosphoribosylformylglycinamidine synthase subunit PurQ [Acidimicrobiales bacterium]
MTARIGVVVFPGTNCEHDVVRALRIVAGDDGSAAELVWHGETSVSRFDALVLPGGFAHGDYLRPGALARFSPVMEAVTGFAADGGVVIGICNGFQVLTEAGLLPGALQKNSGLRFLCTTVPVEVCTTRTPLTACSHVGAVLELPVNHFEGNYICDTATLDRLRDEDRIVLRYRRNPNGSIDDIAGICNTAGNVVGLMPHPERACDELTGATDGMSLVRGLLGVGDRPAPVPA